MGHPGKGVPVCEINGRECPANSFERNTILDMGILCYVVGIVIISEIAMNDLPEYRQGGKREENVNYEDLPVL